MKDCFGCYGKDNCKTLKIEREIDNIHENMYELASALKHYRIGTEEYEILLNNLDDKFVELRTLKKYKCKLSRQCKAIKGLSWFNKFFFMMYGILILSYIGILLGILHIIGCIPQTVVLLVMLIINYYHRKKIIKEVTLIVVKEL